MPPDLGQGPSVLAHQEWLELLPAAPRELLELSGLPVMLAGQAPLEPLLSAPLSAVHKRPVS